MSQSMDEQQMRTFLAELPLFACLDEKSLDRIGRGCRHRQIPKGSILFFQDDPDDGLYIMQSGMVALYISSSDGRELVLGEMRPGDCFGELALITGRPRSTTAVAMLKSDVLIVPSQLILDLMDERPEMIRCFLEVTAQRLYSSTQRESALAFLDAPARLARILLQLEQQSEAPGSYITISQLDLARRVGLTRQTVAKILGRWRRSGWLLTGRGRVVLLDKNALRQVEIQTTF